MQWEEFFLPIMVARDTIFVLANDVSHNTEEGQHQMRVFYLSVSYTIPLMRLRKTSFSNKFFSTDSPR